MDQEKERIIQVIRRYVKNHNLDRAIIFGSFARGEMKEGSDIDIIIISDLFEGKGILDRAKMIGMDFDEEIGMNYALDLLFFTKAEFEHEKDHVTVAREAYREGIVIIP